MSARTSCPSPVTARLLEVHARRHRHHGGRRKLESLREASADDVGGILQLIEPFESDGTLVKRSRTEIERDIGHYTMIEHDGVIFGCAALYPYPESRTGEMAALTVSPNVQGQGDGERILKRASSSAPGDGARRASSCSPRAPCTGSSSAASPGRPGLVA